MSRFRSSVAASGAVALLCASLAACGSGGTPAATVMGRVGPLEVVDGFLPAPASPSVAAVYLTVKNAGSTPDRLVSVTSPVAPSSMLMTEDEQGTSGTMTALTDVVVPAHGSASLSPGHDHAMLEQPSQPLTVGEHVPVTLHFVPAGAVTIQVPVVPLTAELAGGSSGGMGDMPGMKGMGGS